MPFPSAASALIEREPVRTGATLRGRQLTIAVGDGTHGEGGRRRYSVYRRSEPEARNEVWETDHAQLELDLLPLRGRLLVRPWLTVIEGRVLAPGLGVCCRCIRPAVSRVG